MSKKEIKKEIKEEEKKEELFKLFGNFNTVEELNEVAAGFKREGDNENLFKLAAENGIDKETTEAFLNEDIEELTDYFTAAVGKLEVEKQKLEKLKSIMPVNPIADYITSQCMDQNFARIVRSKAKSLEECIKETEKKCREECKRTGEQYIADMTVFEWAKEYYTKE